MQCRICSAANSVHHHLGLYALLSAARWWPVQDVRVWLKLAWCSYSKWVWVAEDLPDPIPGMGGPCRRKTTPYERPQPVCRGCTVILQQHDQLGLGYLSLVLADGICWRCNLTFPKFRDRIVCFWHDGFQHTPASVVSF